MGLRGFSHELLRGDVGVARKIWEQNGGLPKGEGTLQDLLVSVISRKRLESLRFLIETGIDLQSHEGQSTGLLAHSLQECHECFELLLESGARINIELEAFGLRSYVLEMACRRGDLELVKRLVAKGAFTNYDFLLKGVTDPEIVAFIKSVQEGLISTKTSDAIQDIFSGGGEDWFVDHLSQYIGELHPNEIQQLIPSSPVKSVLRFHNSDATVWVTRGLSGVTYPNDEGVEVGSELVFQMKLGLFDGEQDTPDVVTWAVGSLHKIAKLAADVKQPLPFVVVTPDKTIPEFRHGDTRFTHMLLLNTMDEIPFAETEDFDVTFHFVLPLYPQEAALGDKDVAELLQRFDRQGIGRVFDPSRPNVGKLN